jgi:ribosomal protein S18 acetylase RimI-like enzyme
MSMIVRDATTDDLDDLARLLVDITALHARALPHIYPHVVPDAQTTDYLRRVLALEDSALFVAEWDGQVVGFLLVQCGHVPRTPVHVPRQWATIESIVVQEAFRRRGIGEALIQHTHAWAREHGIETVELLVAEFNTAAITWYEKLGYTPLYRRMGYFLGDEARDTNLD